MKVYMCGVAWQHEIGETWVKVFPSVESLKAAHTCTNECGIVELDVEFSEWVKPQDLFGVKNK